MSVKNGYAVLEEYYDEDGKKIGEGYFSKDLVPVNRRKKAYVRYMTITRDDGAQVIEYYNASGGVVSTKAVE